MKSSRYLIVLVAFLSACASSPEVMTSPSDAAATDCMSAENQRLLTYCASPEAADQAARNVEIRRALEEGTPLAQVSPLPIGSSPVKGPEDAAVTIVMFTDLECPFCAKGHAIVESLLAERDDVRLVFKHTPLPMHESAVPAAVGALAAGEQGKFWEFVDLAYSHQDALSLGELIGHAKTLGLDTDAFEKSLEKQEHLDAIQGDLDLAMRAGVTGTPTLFINGVRIPGMLPKDELNALIDAQKTVADRLIESGVGQNEIYWRLVNLNYEPAQERPAQPEPDPEPRIAYVPVDGVPVKGAKADDALVTIVEFSDFECPFCAEANGGLQTVMAKHSDKVRIAFRHFPLVRIHPNAVPAAVAAMVAHESGKFWELHDLLFANQEDLSMEKIMELAASVGVKPEDIQKRFTEEGIDAAQVIEDVNLAQELGVRGTPAFFINGIPVFGAVPEDELVQFIEDQIATAEKLKAERNLSGDALYKALVEINREAP